VNSTRPARRAPARARFRLMPESAQDKAAPGNR
jgi:hypothetical protein